MSSQKLLAPLQRESSTTLRSRLKIEDFIHKSELWTVWKLGKGLNCARLMAHSEGIRMKGGLGNQQPPTRLS